MIQAGVKGQVRWVESLLGTSLIRFLSIFIDHGDNNRERSRRPKAIFYKLT